MAAAHPNPYLVKDTPYPPADYLILLPLLNVPCNTLAFLLIGIMPAIWFLFRALKPVFVVFIRSVVGKWAKATDPKFEPLYRFITDNVLGVFLAVLLLALCEPYLMCVDRGNIELWVVFMVGASLYYFSKARFYSSAAWLVIPISLKIYPCVLLALFVRRRKLLFLVLTIAAAIAVTVFAYSRFEGGIVSNYELNKQQLAVNADKYVVANWGLGQSAAAWNLYRVAAMTVNAIETGTYFDQYWNWYPLEPHFRVALPIYGYCVAVVALFVSIYTIFIEKDVLRRVVVLLLFMVLASPSGAEHKIAHIGSALVAFILIRNRRWGDYVVTALLAFTLIPKKEYLFECLGPTDSGFMDVSSAIVLNPLAMLSALVILFWCGTAKFDSKWSRQRLHGILSGLRPG
jgi:hypothetical protein